MFGTEAQSKRLVILLRFMPYSCTFFVPVFALKLCAFVPSTFFQLCASFEEV